jgi:hypothetical protein
MSTPTPYSRARAQGAQYVADTAKSGLHTIPIPDQDDAWRVYRGRLGDPGALYLGTLTRISPASWVATPVQGVPFGWAGDRDEAARQLAARPFGIRLALAPPAPPTQETTRP